MSTRHGAERLLYYEFQRLAKIVIDPTDQTISSHIVYRPLESVMAEKTVATIISKTLEQTPKYSGKPDHDAEEWFKDLNSKFRMAELTETQALKVISTFLDGPAKEWFLENSTLFETWGSFKAEFINTYSSPATKQLASHRLRTRQQRVDEPIIEYYTDVIKLCKTVDPNMTDVSKIDHLRHGLKSSLMREVLRHTPRTPAEFLEHAKREEVLDQLVNTSLATGTHDDKYVTQSSAYGFAPSPQISAVTSSSRYPSQDARRPPYHHTNNNYNVLSHPTTMASYPPKHSSRCYRCNKPGHFARDCRSSKTY